MGVGESAAPTPLGFHARDGIFWPPNVGVRESANPTPLGFHARGGRKPLFGRPLALLGGFLALFYATLLHDALARLYFLRLVAVF